jgi:transcriptional regulator with XRE-family HTH domain
MGTWLREEIDRRGWSAREFGRRIGVSKSHTSRLVRGDIPPSDKLCPNIAKALGINPQEVMRRAGKLPPLPDDYDKRQEQELCETLQCLSYADRVCLIRFAKFLLVTDQSDDGDEGN